MDGLDQRGHPRRSLWGCFYAAALIMGVLYVTDTEQARSLASTTDGLAAYTWQWTLLTGGAVGLAGNLAPRHHYRAALTAEAAGALCVAFAATVYVSVLVANPITDSIPTATVTWMGSIVAALAGRFIEAFQQRRRAIDYAAARRAIDALNRAG